MPGRLTTGEVAQRVDDALVGILGPGPHVAWVQYSDLYFRPGVYEKLVADPRAMQAAIDALRAVPGVWRVLRSDELEARRPTDDPVARAVGLSHYPGRSGDLIVVPKPYWVLGNAATMHGTLHEYDRRVPIVFFGKRDQARRILPVGHPCRHRPHTRISERHHPCSARRPSTHRGPGG